MHALKGCRCCTTFQRQVVQWCQPHHGLVPKLLFHKTFYKYYRSENWMLPQLHSSIFTANQLGLLRDTRKLSQRDTNSQPGVPRSSFPWTPLCLPRRRSPSPPPLSAKPWVGGWWWGVNEDHPPLVLGSATCRQTPGWYGSPEQFSPHKAHSQLTSTRDNSQIVGIR